MAVPSHDEARIVIYPEREIRIVRRFRPRGRTGRRAQIAPITVAGRALVRI